MSDPFRLVMLSAMYENGGNTCHRFLDGHPQLAVYPFESQLGTSLVSDALSSTFPKKYRWPEFPLSGDVSADYQLIIDEEYKVCTRTPQVSKFRNADFQARDHERKKAYLELLQTKARTRANIMEAFFRATFLTWKNYYAAAPFSAYVGYSPVLIPDTDKILADFPTALIVHVVRNPFSAYADTKKRPVPLSLPNYMLAWSLNQHFALLFRQKYPQNVLILRLEDVLADSRSALAPLLSALGLFHSPLQDRPTWNGKELPEVYPWGTIRKATLEANENTAQELSSTERDDVVLHAGPFLKLLGYA